MFVALPLFSIFQFYFSQNMLMRKKIETQAKPPARSPDVYYIILDAYTREDTLNELGFDNSEFLDELREIGFYVANCSTSNYSNTANSMATTLNMNYLWEVIPQKNAKDTGTTALFASIKNSYVENYFRDLGYKFVAFETGGHWLNMDDADFFFKPDNIYFWSETLLPFEDLFIKTTILKPFIEREIIDLRINDTDFSQFIIHHKTIHYALDTLPSVAQIDEPTFTYFHILVPHPPFSFLPDGSFNPDPNYYNDKTGSGYGISREHNVTGYVNNVKFANSRILNVVKKLIKDSEIPPVIIIQGDHGMPFIEGKAFNILNAYYLPNVDSTVLYPNISPVNSFRIVFNEYFDEEFETLDDVNVRADMGYPFRKNIKEPSPCP